MSVENKGVEEGLLLFSQCLMNNACKAWDLFTFGVDNTE